MRRTQRPSHPAPTLLNATYYGVLTLSGMTGLMAYSSGATLEGALIRMAVTLLTCTILGYLINVVFLLTSIPPAKKEAISPAKGGGKAGRKGIDIVAGDDSQAGLSLPTGVAG